MSPRIHRIPAATVVAAAAAILLVSACSASGSTGQRPSVTFGPDVSTTPGMAGHGMTGTTAPPVANASPTASASAAPQSANAVDITNFAFAPSAVTIPAGSTLTWTNHDEEPHTVAAGDGSFHSPGMGAGATYSFLFANPGTFDYVCSIHPFMHGTVVVTK